MSAKEWIASAIKLPEPVCNAAANLLTAIPKFAKNAYRIAFAGEPDCDIHPPDNVALKSV